MAKSDKNGKENGYQDMTTIPYTLVCKWAYYMYEHMASRVLRPLMCLNFKHQNVLTKNKLYHLLSLELISVLR